MPGWALDAWRWCVTQGPLPNIVQIVSGPGLAAAIIIWWRHQICQQHGCPRLAFHRVRGTTYKTCTRHAVPAVHAALIRQHAAERPEQHALLNGP